MLEKDSSVLKDYEAAVQYEWLETNGLGGWSSSTIIGCHTRRYHGLLVAATVPPAERMSLLSKLEETIILDNQCFALGTNNYGDVIYPEGYKHASSFTKDLFPVFTYAAGAVQLQKTISMVNGENTVVINYKLLKAPGTCQLELLPLFSVRDYHSLMQANNNINQQATFQEDIFTARLYEGTPTVYIKVPGAAFHPDPCWFRHFYYSVENSRGLDAEEDLFSYGKFSVAMKEGESLGIIVSTLPPGKKEALVLLQAEKERKLKLLKNQPADDMLQQLLLAADQFIVQRMLTIALPHETAREGATVIAGYHWFADWARDTMIALPGLTLSTGRYAEARKILAAFTSAVSQGMLPNRFMDNGQPPEYNTVDGTLWYFVAVFKYLRATADRDFVLQQILPVLKNIIAWHFKGTRYNIHVADDGLLFAGQTGQQLTWMDAKVDDWVVTPRIGKPVEIQALWYNALKIFSALLALNGEADKAANADAHAEITRKSFTEKFWCASGNHLYDLIDEHGRPDKTIRPNQLFALSLPFPLVEGERAKLVLEVAEKQLYTVVGLRSLSRLDKHYLPVYSGDRYQRDATYHQGTVWSWLLGPYIDAIMAEPGLIGFDGLTGRSKAMHIIDNFRYHLAEAGIGTVSEIFDGGEPHLPRGCIAQAWGVAELLRVMVDYKLYQHS